MKNISDIAKLVNPSATLRIDALYKQMKADGMDVIGFGAGEPDFDTPENIKIAAHDAIDNNRTRYTPAAGIPELRAAAAERLNTDCSAKYRPEQIVIASGAKHSIYIALRVLLNIGDEVILPAPYWVSYFEMIKMMGAVPAVIQTDEQTKFKITPQQLEAAVNDKTKLIIICNPSNPTGMLYTAGELEKLTDVCVKHDLYIMADEIYYRLIYDGIVFKSMAGLGVDIGERLILINGVSKTYAMTGWRIGYSASNPDIAKAMSDYLSHSTGAPSSVSQYAALEALSGNQESAGEMRCIFEKRRDYIVSRINAMNGVNCLKPDGAFYIMMNISSLAGRSFNGKIIRNSDDFAFALLENERVATVSCTAFGCDNYIRLTYTGSMDTIRGGMDRLERFINKFD